MNISIYYKEKKLKEPYLSLFNEYRKRLSKDAKIHLKKNKQDLSKNEYCIMINPDSRLLSSEEFAEKLREWRISSHSNLAFYINENPDRKDFDFGLLASCASDEMTLAVLLEQIYRSFSILNGKNYHK